MVHCQQPDTLFFKQIDEVFLPLRRYILRHIVQHDYIVIPAAYVLEYLAVVFLLGLDVLDINISLEQ